MAKKHYRASKKQSDYSPAKGTIIPNNKKPKLIGLFIGLLVFAFLKGLLIGFLTGRKE